MYRLDEIAERFGFELQGDPALVVAGLCGLSDDLPGHLSFVGAPKHAAAAQRSNIPAFVTRAELPIEGKVCLFHPHPEYAIALVGQLFERSKLTQVARIHASADIHPSAELAPDVVIGANVVIGQDTRIGPRTRIMPGSVVMDRVQIGADCLVYPNAVVREDSVLGDRVLVQPGAIIGGDGYGFVQYEGRHVKIPQLGRVVLEDDVEIGANTTVDRGRFTETRIGRGTKIDNLVMLAHNVRLGENCLICAQSGISGSTRLGDRVTFAGQVGVAGHIDICSDVTVLGKSSVTKGVRTPGVYAGIPFRPVERWRKAVARFYRDIDHERDKD
ncbi:MAG: UDP-3-O-(3-hydroxymyristoyl)glucosamine N-acyltransferase [Gammaproteobacteria bacterium]|nr:UDP-3-O-(3-hydroxymyristoyl)glucosamine N-acyltransferase [Gammaproteobacteria bacterium]MBI5616989.1 UDP-3-O-(3-hydroxymyristoyl)glucosamine N-acyltransferase [Gammaproteobacteria bacterium]